MTFEEFWEQEEQKALFERLQEDYPAWQHRRRLRRAAAVSLAVVAVVIISTFTFQLSPSDNNSTVCCNRSGIPDAYWDDMAAKILMTETL